MIVYDGFVRVEKVGKAEVVHTTNSVAFLVYNKTTDEVLFVSQSRVPMISPDNPDGIITEVAAGRFDKALGVKGLIQQELLEELGVTAKEDQIHILNNGKPLAVSPGVMSEKQYLAYVEITDDQIDGANRVYGVDEDEKITRLFVPANELRKFSYDDIKTWALVQWWLAAEDGLDK